MITLIIEQGTNVRFVTFKNNEELRTYHKQELNKFLHSGYKIDYEETDDNKTVLFLQSSPMITVTFRVVSSEEDKNK